MHEGGQKEIAKFSLVNYSNIGVIVTGGSCDPDLDEYGDEGIEMPGEIHLDSVRMFYPEQKEW